MKFLLHTMWVIGLLACQASAAATLAGPAALRMRHGALATQLAESTFGEPLVLQSREANNRIEGDAYAVLPHPFATVAAVLADSARWCDVLILHLNIKHCRRNAAGEVLRIEVRVGKKTEQSVRSATLLAFEWQPAVVHADYFAVRMAAPDGPYDTREYVLFAEAVPLDGGRTFLHMGYAFGYGGASHFAMHLYLATVGRDKVGFSVEQPAAQGHDAVYVGGMRGVVERNTMRYFLAIRGYLDALALPPERQLEQRLALWFDATERFPRQLHEVERDAYLRMKRNEVERQNAP